MTLFSRRRRRRYSWPYSTPNTSRIQERQNRIPDRDLHALKHYFADGKNINPQRVPIVQTTEKFRYEDDEDDAVSAGIVRSRTMRNARPSRIWPSSCCDDSDDKMDDDDDIVSTVTEAGEVPSAILRRIVPQVDRAKMFSQHSSSSNRHGRVDKESDDVMVSYFETNEQSQGSQSHGRRIRSQDRNLLADPRLRPEQSQRMHRRCHSEQPRAWREPSAELWPLKEE